MTAEKVGFPNGGPPFLLTYAGQGCTARTLRASKDHDRARILPFPHVAAASTAVRRFQKMLEKYRKTVMQARLMLVCGRVQRHESIIHVVATALEDRSEWLNLLSEWQSSIPIPFANADEVKNPGPDPKAAGGDEHPRWSRKGAAVRPRPMHPREERVIPKSRDFH